MTRSRTLLPLLTGFAIVATALSVLLSTDELGLGRRPDGSPRFPFVFEDAYDRLAYQQRGRWLPAGGRPYLEDFAEYPQVSVFVMGLPYLTFDHGVPPAERSAGVRSMRRPTSYASERRLAEALRAGGASPPTIETFLDAIWRAARGSGDVPFDALVAPLGLEPERAQGLRPDVSELARRVRAREAELARNRTAYGDRHHVHMAVLFALLLVLATANLKHLGAPPAFALLVVLPASLYFGFNRLDLVVTTLVALALFCELRGRTLWAGAVLGLAVMAKYYPVVLVPLFAAHAIRRERANGRPLAGALVHGGLALGLAAGAVIALILGVTYLWQGGGLDAVLALPRWYVEDRMPNHASLLAQLTHPRRWGWVDPAGAGWVERLFQLVQLAPALLFFAPLRSDRALILSALVATLTMILFSEFFSPQWVLWVTALALYVAPRWRRFLWLAIALEAVMYLQLPLFYFEALGSGVPFGAYHEAPEFARFRLITDVRIALVALFLVVTAATLVRELRAQRQPGSAPGGAARVS